MSVPTNIYLLKFSNINSEIKWQISSKLRIETQDFVPRCPKNTFPKVFCNEFFAFNTKWTKWSQYQFIDVQRLWLYYKF